MCSWPSLEKAPSFTTSITDRSLRPQEAEAAESGRQRAHRGAAEGAGAPREPQEAGDAGEQDLHHHGGGLRWWVVSSAQLDILFYSEGREWSSLEWNLCRYTILYPWFQLSQPKSRFTHCIIKLMLYTKQILSSILKILLRSFFPSFFSKEELE